MSHNKRSKEPFFVLSEDSSFFVLSEDSLFFFFSEDFKPQGSRVPFLWFRFQLDMLNNMEVEFLIYSWDPQLRHRLCYRTSLRLGNLLATGQLFHQVSIALSQNKMTGAGHFRFNLAIPLFHFCLNSAIPLFIPLLLEFCYSAIPLPLKFWSLAFPLLLECCYLANTLLLNLCCSTSAWILLFSYSTSAWILLFDYSTSA